MNKCIRISEFAKQLFTDQKTAQQASQILQGIMDERSPRMSDIAARMPGNEAASYKRIQQFLQKNQPQETLRLLFNEEAEFVIGDPTEIERPHAEKTSYVGTLMDGMNEGLLDADIGNATEGQSHPISLPDVLIAHI